MDLSFRKHSALTALDLTTNSRTVDLFPQGVLDLTISKHQTTTDTDCDHVLNDVTSPLSGCDIETGSQDDGGYDSEVDTSGCPSLPISAYSGSEIDIPLDVNDSESFLTQHQFQSSSWSEDRNCKTQHQMEFGGLSEVRCCKSPTIGFGFCDSLSTIFCGEDIGSQDVPLSVPCPAESYLSEMPVALSEHSPTSVQSDPLLSSGHVCREDRESCMSNVMEDMNFLENLLERVDDSDNSQDSVFSAPSPLRTRTQEDVSSFSRETHRHPVYRPPVVSNLVSDTQSQDTSAEQPKPESSVLATRSGYQALPILNTLLVKKESTASACPSLTRRQALEYIPTTPVSTHGFGLAAPSVSVTTRSPAVQRSHLPTSCSKVEQAHPKIKRSHEIDLPSDQIARQSKLKTSQVVPQQKRMIIRYKTDLPRNLGSTIRREGKDEVRNVVNNSLLPALPDELLNFAVQYCDSGDDLDNTTLKDSQQTGNVDQYVSKESHTSPHNLVMEKSPKAMTDIDYRDFSYGELNCQESRAGEDKDGSPVVFVKKQKMQTDEAEPVRSSPYSLIQSSVISSTLQDVQPVHSSSMEPGTDDFSADSVKSPEKESAVILRSPSQEQFRSVLMDGCQFDSPALSLQMYSSPHTCRTTDTCMDCPDSSKRVVSDDLQSSKAKRMRAGNDYKREFRTVKDTESRDRPAHQSAASSTTPVTPKHSPHPSRNAEADSCLSGSCSSIISCFSDADIDTDLGSSSVDTDDGSRHPYPPASDTGNDFCDAHLSVSDTDSGSTDTHSYVRDIDHGFRNPHPYICDTDDDSRGLNHQVSDADDDFCDPHLSGDGSRGPQSPAFCHTPVPANGGGKPLNAMSELEKHLRGLMAPPDQRHKDPRDPLVGTPVDECLWTGSKSLLQMLLTGELSHERYRQIDYQLLYQERERRLRQNAHSS